MGKENINFVTVWIILGKIFATFSSDPEPATTPVFGKTESSIGCNYVMMRFLFHSLVIDLQRCCSADMQVN